MTAVRSDQFGNQSRGKAGQFLEEHKEPTNTIKGMSKACQAGHTRASPSRYLYKWNRADNQPLTGEGVGDIK